MALRPTHSWSLPVVWWACADDKKDEVIFVTEEEQEDVKEEVDSREMGSAVGPDGEIDWDCPCLKVGGCEQYISKLFFFQDILQ